MEGYSQPGAKPNTLAAGNNAVLDNLPFSRLQALASSPTPRNLTLTEGWARADFDPNALAFYKDAEGVSVGISPLFEV